eukprot:3075504-Pleurochrysis_carterae.AAC.2
MDDVRDVESWDVHRNETESARVNTSFLCTDDGAVSAPLTYSDLFIFSRRPEAVSALLLRQDENQVRPEP